jgi:trans-aconitate 2-methyltransferase
MRAVPSRSWDAAVYHRVSGVQRRWARDVLDRLPLAGSETVLDAGCGSGAVTAMLLERLPAGHVIAVDASPEMVEHARATLDPTRTTVFEADLAALELAAPVDAVFSNAVFHWVPDHDALFAGLHRALRPGGRLAAQCGGEGNLARFLRGAREVAAREPYAAHLAGIGGWSTLAGAATTRQRLTRAGFRDVRAWIEADDVTPQHPAAFVRTVNLRVYVEALPEALRDPFVDDVLERAGRPLVLDYKRLNVDATA